MKRILALCIATLALGGCADIRALETVYGASASPQQVYIAANTYDAIELTASKYGNYCRAHLTTEPLCSAVNRRVVVRGIRAGRVARNQLETYLVQGTSAPAQIYNTLVAVVNSLQKSAAAKVTVQ